MMKEDITTEELAVQAKKASKRAIEKAQALGVPYTVQEGKKLVKHYPDGRKEVIDVLPKAYFQPKKASYTIR